MMPVASCGVLLLLAMTALPAGAVQRELTELSLEELMDVEVTSVSKRPEPRSEAAAAIAVITHDEIRRSGARSVPEALRFAPGLHVARVTANSWAVSSRGFSSINSAKLLVLADGRSVYTPLFSGVFWDVQDFVLDDISRIEVVRGPGGTLWGANAVNGVINIVSKNARETQGIFLNAGGGTEERAFGTVRYGGRVGNNFHYRIYAKYADRDEGYHPADLDDDWQMARTGFRADWDLSDRDQLTLQGDLYRGESGQIRPALTLTGITPPAPPLEVDLSGGNILGRWRRVLGELSYLQLQAYYDRNYRDDPTFADSLDTFDVQIERGVALPGNQDLLFGAEYRLMADNFVGRSGINLDPARSQDHLFSALLQDRIRLFDDTVQITIGTKLEHNDFSGFEIQPTGRIAWLPIDTVTLWGAISRAVRVPTRIERDLSAQTTGDGGLNLNLVGGRDLVAEKLISYELGTRWAATPELNFDLAGFYNEYQSLVTFEVEFSPAMDEAAVFNTNRLEGHAHGAEAAVTWMPVPWATLVGTYTYLYLSLHRDSDSLDINGTERFERASPHNQVGLRSHFDLPAGFELDLMSRYVDSLGSAVENPEPTSNYFNLDTRFGWRSDFGLELSLLAHNLLEKRHREFAGATGVQRGVYGRATYRF